MRVYWPLYDEDGGGGRKQKEREGERDRQRWSISYALHMLKYGNSSKKTFIKVYYIILG